MNNKLLKLVEQLQKEKTGQSNHLKILDICFQIFGIVGDEKIDNGYFYLKEWIRSQIKISERNLIEYYREQAHDKV